jgi:hypothetical protein
MHAYPEKFSPHCQSLGICGKSLLPSDLQRQFPPAAVYASMHFMHAIHNGPTPICHLARFFPTQPACQRSGSPAHSSPLESAPRCGHPRASPPQGLDALSERIIPILAQRFSQNNSTSPIGILAGASCPSPSTESQARIGAGIDFLTPKASHSRAQGRGVSRAPWERRQVISLRQRRYTNGSRILYNAFGVTGHDGIVTQGSPEDRRPWAMMSNRFAVKARKGDSNRTLAAGGRDGYPRPRSFTANWHGLCR